MQFFDWVSSSHLAFFQITRHTHPKTDMSPEIQWLEYVFPIEIVPILRDMLVFRDVDWIGNSNTHIGQDKYRSVHTPYTSVNTYLSASICIYCIVSILVFIGFFVLFTVVNPMMEYFACGSGSGPNLLPLQLPPLASWFEPVLLWTLDGVSASMTSMRELSIQSSAKSWMRSGGVVCQEFWLGSCTRMLHWGQSSSSSKFRTHSSSIKLD